MRRLHRVEKGQMRDMDPTVYADSLRLPKPRRKVTAPGYTHLVDSFSYKRDKTGIDVGWGKYYGPMLEHGTKKMSAKAHLKPLFEQNKERYYKKMIAALDL